MRQDQRVQIRQAVSEIWLDVPHPVSRQQQHAQPRRQGEVGDGCDVVVGEIDGILGTGDTEVLDCRDFVACWLRGESGMSMELIV